MSAKKSERSKLIDQCKDLIRELKFKTFGKKCQLCGSEKQLGLFHILSVGAHPRLQLHEDNILIACWFGCHYKHHHDPFYARDVIFPKIAKLLGERWEENLLELERTEPKLSITRIREILEELKERSQ